MSDGCTKVFTTHPLIKQLTCVLGTVIGLSVTMVAIATPIDDLRKQVESSQFDQAYQTAQANPDQIGTPHFDFLYGLAAIGAGHVAEGVLALERHLTVVPANDRARLELARGYFLLGELSRARTEFEFVLKHNPPKDVQANIRHYLDSMQTRDVATLRATSKLYIDVGYGHDSNVNGGTYNKDIRLLSGTIPIANGSSLAIPDNVRLLTIGGQLNKRISPKLAVFAGGDVDIHANQKQSAYSLYNYGAYLGFSYLKDSGLYRLSIADSEMNVGSGMNTPRYRNMYSLTGEAQYTLTPGSLLTGFAQYGEASYLGVNQVLDSKTTTLGASITQLLDGVPMNPSLGLRMSMARESNLRMRPDLSRNIPTIQFYGAMMPMEQVGFSFGLTVQKQSFLQADLAFGTSRRDTTKIIDLGISYAIDRNWSARGEFQASDNRSNQNLYDSKRRSSAIKLRYEF